jgi:hypothetical protein
VPEKEGTTTVHTHSCRKEKGRMEVARDGGKTRVGRRRIQRFNNNKQKYFTIIKYLFIVQLRDGEQFW